MTTQVFSGLYASTYDDVYAQKAYEDECDLVEQLIREHGKGAMGRILDLGCGTGGHSVVLASRGYHVVGVDRSEDMLVRARLKGTSLGVSAPAFHAGDIRTIELDDEFDVALIMFAVLSYQTANADVLAALRNARAHLRSGGLVIFDVWYGPAVLHERPGQRLGVFETERGLILRAADGSLDVARHTCDVEMRLWEIDGNTVVSYVEEQHVMRFFFPLELDLFLSDAGFAPVRTAAFPEITREPDETTWNTLVVARAVDVRQCTTTADI